MVSLIIFTKTCTITLTFLLLATSFHCQLGNAQINPMQVAGNALSCFNNKLIYRGCNKDYQLDESGHLDVPCEETNQYCNGPCFSETKSLLKCINNMASNFLFSNGATTQVLGNALDNGCNGYITQRGTFIEGNDYNIPGRSCGLNLSDSPSEAKLQSFAITLILLAGCSLFLFQIIVV